METLIFAMLLLQGPPQINTWEKVTEIHYEIKNTVKSKNKNVIATSMIGSLKILKNPELQNEFAFIVSKYPPLTFTPQLTQGGENEYDEIIVAENYFKKTRQDKLKERVLSSDTILFIKWRENKDPRTGEKILESSIENWLRDANGRWIFEESAKSAIKIELLSEDGLLIGFKFSLGKNYHILRFDQEHLEGVK